MNNDASSIHNDIGNDAGNDTDNNSGNDTASASAQASATADAPVLRQIVLDTETTGLEIADGNRIIEIGCVEIIKRRITRGQSGRYHQYLNPDRDSEEGALAVHGLTTEFLSDKPRFADVVDDFLAFIKGAELLIHNAAFDIGYLNHELSLLGSHYGRIEDYCTVTDTLVLAKEKHPGQRNSLDALCKRYEVDNSHRELHGALLDAEILADVYLRMTGGQGSLGLGSGAGSGANLQRRINANRAPLPIVRANAAELAAHEEWLKVIDKASGGKTVWRQYETPAGDAG